MWGVEDVLGIGQSHDESIQPLVCSYQKYKTDFGFGSQLQTT